MGADLYLNSEFNKADPKRYKGNGYFRDSYNSTSVLWKLGLSWWEDILPRVKGGYLGLSDIKWLLDEIILRKPVLNEKLSRVENKDDRNWYKYHYAELVTFLKRALEKKEAIEASL